MDTLKTLKPGQVVNWWGTEGWTPKRKRPTYYGEITLVTGRTAASMKIRGKGKMAGLEVLVMASECSLRVN